jgi:hypothetical protein
MTNHVFVNHCVDFESILAAPDLDKMLREAYKQSKTEEAKLRVDFDNYKDYGVDQWCPAYFGMFVEWLAWHYLNHFGHLYNIQAVEMTDSEGSSVEDYGTDGKGMSIKDQVMSTTGRKALKGAPVYIQVKGTMNNKKEYKPNDGSRLPNFGMNAMSSAIKEGRAYQARYIVVTTGKGFHYSLEKMSNSLLEVIAYKQLSATINRDTVFLNRLRNSVGLTTFPVIESKVDAEAAVIHDEIATIA